MKKISFPLQPHGNRAVLTSLSVALLLVAPSAWSLDLLESYQAAKQQDASFLASRAATDAGRERLPQARSQFFPSLSANAGRTKNRLDNTTQNLLGVEQTTQTEYPSSNESLTLRQPLFRTALTAQYRQAKAQVDEAEASLAQEEQSLAVRVTSAYFEALLTNEQLDLVLSQKNFSTTQLDVARKSFAAGSGTRTDVDEAQARLDMTAALEVEARENVAFTMRQLQTLVNQPVGTLAKLNVAKLNLAPTKSDQLDDWVAKAERANPQMIGLQAQLEAARQEVSKAKSGHYPTLDAVAQWTRSQSESVTNITSRYTNNSIGLQLNVPIFAGGYVNSTVRQANANQERAVQAIEAFRRDLGVRVYKEFRGVTESIPKIKAYEQALRSADQVVLSSQKSFQAGSRTVVDVLNAEQQRMLVMRDLAQSRFAYLISKIRLLALVGDADVDAIAEMNRLFN